MRWDFLAKFANKNNDARNMLSLTINVQIINYQ